LEPLFPGYLFSRLALDSQSWIAARSAPGVSYFLGTRELPTPLPEALVAEIRTQVDARSRARQLRVFHPGERVLIQSGPFAGLEAIFDGSLGAAGRVRVLLAVVNRLAPVDLHIDNLRPVAEDLRCA
jgi:transcription antitermination factor NusG